MNRKLSGPTVQQTLSVDGCKQKENSWCTSTYNVFFPVLCILPLQNWKVCDTDKKIQKKLLGHLRLKCIQIYPSLTNTDLSVHAKCSIWCLHTFFQSVISIPNIQNQPNTSRGLWLGGPNMNWGYPNHTLILWLNWKLCDLNMQLIPEGIVQLKHACTSGSKLAQSHSECVSGIPSNNMQ